jgi:uncharacterized protein (UPF0276 family)
VLGPFLSFMSQNFPPYQQELFGLGLRQPHIPEALSGRLRADWLEVISEGYMGMASQKLESPALNRLLKVREHYPVALHGVSLSIGGSDPLDLSYLARLRELAARVEAAWVSDHLCWTGVHGRNFHDLLPLPYTEETLIHVAGRIEQVQEFLGRRILIENVSAYVDYRSSTMTEWDFLAALAERADCYLLCDLNNIHVSAHNQGFDAFQYLRALPLPRIREFHLAGPSEQGRFLVDTHDHPVREDVWELYSRMLGLCPRVPTLLEWDSSIPTAEVLATELDKARALHEQGRRLHEVTL